MPAPSVTEEEVAADLEVLDQATARAAEEANAEAGAGANEIEVEVDPEQAASATPEVLADPVPNDGFGDGNEGFFDGIEGHDDGAGESGDPFAESDAGEPGDPFAGEGAGEIPGGEPLGESEPHSFAEPINAGAARLAVVGMDDDEEKDDLKTEFEEVFEEFQLGHYGSETMHEYVLHGQDDIDPIWGLAGSALLCSVIVVWMRPDGDELVHNAKETVSSLANRDNGGSLS